MDRRQQINSELLTILKFAAKFAIALILILLFTISHGVNPFGLLASLGLGGLALAFAAQKNLEQLFGGIILYLDRPFVLGDYIRLADGQLGRVETIGLRSTKIRAIGKGTLLVIPNSNLVSMEIENVTMAKKVMVLLYLDFSRSLEERETALIQEAIRSTTADLYGIDPKSTSITMSPKGDGHTTTAQVSLSILGSNESSIELRKRLLDLAGQRLTQQLHIYGLEFQLQEPTIYVESPVTV